MPLTFAATGDATPYGIALSDCYAVISDFSADVTKWTITVTVYADQNAFAAGKQPGWTHQFEIAPTDGFTAQIEAAVMAALSNVPGVSNLVQV